MAFAVHIIEQILRMQPLAEPKIPSPIAIIIEPTHELCYQVCEQFTKLADGWLPIYRIEGLQGHFRDEHPHCKGLRRILEGAQSGRASTGLRRSLCNHRTTEGLHIRAPGKL